MKLRNVIFQLAARYKLDRHSTTELQTMAGLLGQPSWLPARLPFGAAIAGAALLGLGIMFWVAANWDILGRFGRIALLQGMFAASLVAAWNYPAWRHIAAQVATAAIGGLLACLGQTYPSGADPWQLFALWSVLVLPLGLASRSDVIWMPWLLVTLLAIRLYIDHSNQTHAPHLPSHVAGWLGALLLVGLVCPQLRRFSGCGTWSFRLAAIGALAFVIESCWRFGIDASAIATGTVLLGLATLVATQAKPLDLPVVAILALGFDVLVSAFAVTLVGSARAGFIQSLIVVALAVIATFAATAHFLIDLHRQGEQP